MITPAAAMAPVMPMTRPRTSGVWPAKEKPCFREPRKLSCSPVGPAARLPLIDGRFQMTTAATRNVTALRYSARSTWSVLGMTSLTRPPRLLSTANTIAASTGVSP
jgi:hypothetical protein